MDSTNRVQLGWYYWRIFVYFTVEIHREPENPDKHVDRNNEQIAMEDSNNEVGMYIIFLPEIFL